MDLMYQQLKNDAQQIMVLLKPSLLHVNLRGGPMAI